jgi:LysM repeat protein
MDSWTINKNVKDWRDKSIVHVPTESMKEITITAGSKMYRFNNDSSGWKLGEKSVETSEMNPLLNTLSNLRADDFIDTVAEIISKPITIDLKSMENISLSLYPTLPDSSHYFVKSSRSQQTYVVNKWTAQQLFKPMGKILPVSAHVQQVAETPKKETEVQPTTVTTPTKKPITKEPITETKKSDDGKKQISTSPQPAKPSQAETKKPVAEPKQTPPTVKTIPPSAEPTKTKAEPTKQAIEDEGELTVHTVAKGETMTTIAKKYNVTTEQILKWNLLKTIAVKPGQELYIYVRK